MKKILCAIIFAMAAIVVIMSLALSRMSVDLTISRTRDYVLFEQISNIYYGKGAWDANDPSKKQEKKYNEWINDRVIRELTRK
jgi:hypothetical protein